MVTASSPIARANAGIHQALIEFIRKHYPDLQHRIVDLGCGSGAFLHALHTAGYANLTGVDIQPPTSAHSGISFLTLDLDSGGIPLESGSVDLLSAIEVVEHVENLGLFLSEAHRLLAQGSHFLLTTPNVHSVEARLRFFLSGKLKQFDEIGDPTHVAPFFLHPATKLLMRHGFETLAVWGLPENGQSPTSRLGLRCLGQVFRSLGIKTVVSGDNLCLLLRKMETSALAHDKTEQLTSHYQ